MKNKQTTELFQPNASKIILITMGDPNGVGPEICMRLLLRQLRSLRGFIPVVVGDPLVLEQARQLFPSASRPLVVVDSLSQVNPKLQGIPVWSAGIKMKGKIRPGQVHVSAGRAAIGWVREAVLACQRGEAAAIVTAPICKEAIEPLIPGFQGHTEFIGGMCGDEHPVLTLVHEKWVIAHVSTHVSLREAIERVQPPRIHKVARLLHAFLQKYRGLAEPRIGVAGLNPHAGENGLFGREELDIIAPEVKHLQKQGLNIHGPIPADVVFPQMRSQHFDGVVAMYHDQGHVVTKSLLFDLSNTEKKRRMGGVNLTLGLPVLRTSVDHGTGFDIAWKGQGDEHSLEDALRLAITLLM